MNKKKLNLKLTFRDQTFGFFKGSSDGFVFGFPQEKPLCHLTALFDKERFSIHASKDKEIGKDRYDDSRVELKFDDSITNHLAQHDWLQYTEECQASKMPGKMYLGGYFHALRDDAILQSKYLSLEDLFNNIYIVKARHLRLYPERMWLVLDKERGKNGRWHDIGYLYGPFNNRIFYFPYKKLAALLNSLAKMLRLIDVEEESLKGRESRILFDIDKKTKNIITSRSARLRMSGIVL